MTSPTNINLLSPSPSKPVVPSINLLDSAIPAPAPTPVAAPFNHLTDSRDFGDVGSLRSNIYGHVLQAANSTEPLTNKTHSLHLANVRYIDPESYSIKQQKQAILTGQSQGRRLKGTWELRDAAGQTLDQREQVIASVPYVTQQGTFIHNGSEYTLRNQQRLRPGIFTRRKENGEIESHANILPGKGPSHRYFLDPEKGVFYIKLGQAKLPLMPLVKALGATPEQLQEAWGPNLYAANYAKDDPAAYSKLKAKLLRPADLDGDDRTAREKLIGVFQNMELDPEVTQRTLGKPYKGIGLDTMLDITKKLLAVSKGEADHDDRDSLPFQRFLGPEDLFAERIRRDHGMLRRQLLFKASQRGDLGAMPSSALKPQVEAALTTSGLGQSLEEINPAEIYDKLFSITRLGEGGIPSMDAIPDEARNVQPSHFGYMDPVRTPESFKVGVDVYMATNSRKGRDGKLYGQFFSPKTGQSSWKTPQDLADAAVATDDVMHAATHLVPVIRNGKYDYVPKSEVDYIVPHFEHNFSPLGNMIPLKSQVKPQRMAMASRMLTQALPLKNPQAPWVQSGVPGSGGGRSYEQEYAKSMGALHADKPGRVVSVDPDGIKLQYADGSVENKELYNNYPFNRKTYIHQTPAVKPGDVVQPGAILAHSNYTDQTGTTALGRNFRTAYMSWNGANFEDATVISESAAKNFSSEHMYQHQLEVDDRTKLGMKHYVGLFPGRFDRATLARMDDNGVIRPGMTVEQGQPLILAAREREMAHNKVHKRGQAGYADASITWEHSDPGVVTDVVQSKHGPVVLVKSTNPMQVGDKMSGRYGDKGVVAAIIPDSKMPHDKDGRPYEVLLNPLGIISRTNPAQKVELALGKIAEMTGQPFKIEDFEHGKDYLEWAINHLQKHGMQLEDDLTDPNTGRRIKGIPTGSRFFMKLHHTAESKGQARGSGGYTAEGTPSKGGATGSKRVAMLDTNALLAHGATETLRDAMAVRGQQDENSLLQFMQGHNPGQPKVPMVYEKFVNQLKSAGINVVRDGNKTNVMALTNKDIDVLAGDRLIKHGQTVNFDKGLKPITGGLFDTAMTGGHDGRRWSAIQLDEPMPNPVMEEPIRRMLDLTTKQFEGVLTGEHDLGKHGTGPQAISKALQNINVDREIELARTKIDQGSKSERDQAIRKLGYLRSAKAMNLHPADWVLNRAPVLPPAFRPISMMGNKMPLVADPNYLYKELIAANDNLRKMKNEVGHAGSGPERLAVYHAFKAVTGLGDPLSQKSREKGIKGVLASVFGNSPKFSSLQRKLISTTVDNVGRAVITPNPDLDMDSVGLPEDKAFDIYSKFVARRMKRSGMPLTRALEEIKARTPLARKLLVEEMGERPVYINRAPVLHKFGILAFRPQLMKGDTMQISPLVVKGFNADFDGDAMNFHVPTDEGARKEAYERLLPSRSLLSPADFKSPVHAPSNEYVGGLYHATSSKSSRQARVFRSISDAKAAYARGDIDINDQVQILQ